MKKRLSVLAALLLISLTTSCAGVRQTSKTFTAHGEAFRIVGFAVPSDDMQLALDKVPAGATITNVNSSAADWTSVVGVLNNILSFTGTQIGGTK